jgi:uncharacterized protein
VIAAQGEKHNLRAIQKVEKGLKGLSEDWPILETTDNAEVARFLARGGAQVGAGTAFLWAHPELANSLDVLVVDEAGQMSLASVLGASRAASSIILIGDPQQLEQPVQGSHPEGTDLAVLDHVLQGSTTVSSERGLFLDKSWRLHPAICEFTSEVFYDGRLQPQPGLDSQQIIGSGPLSGSGLTYRPVSHSGNSSSSPEEVDAIEALVSATLLAGSEWVGTKGRRPLVLDDILIVAPYNAQVTLLSTRLPNARIGTVDKFQGQEAPIVIYSMTSSSATDAPRGMEFLYNPNRFNVATSRAKALCVVVGNPQLFEPECRTPRQIRLANAFCRYREMASTLGDHPTRPGAAE